MSDDQLIDELAGRAELFALEANGALRRWFTRKLLTYVQAGPPPHDDRADLLAAIALARSLVEECRVALQPQSDTDLRLLLLLDLAVRTAYGALGVHPAALLHDDRADYLLFIVKRRIFAVDRMERGVSEPAPPTAARSSGWPAAPAPAAAKARAACASTRSRASGRASTRNQSDRMTCLRPAWKKVQTAIPAAVLLRALAEMTNHIKNNEWTLFLAV